MISGCGGGGDSAITTEHSSAIPLDVSTTGSDGDGGRTSADTIFTAASDQGAMIGTTAALATFDTAVSGEPQKHILGTSASTTVQVVRMSDFSANLVAVPDMNTLKPFEAIPPYFVETKDGPKRVKLGIYGTWEDIRRGFDFVRPIINPETNRTNALTLQMPVLTSNGMQFVNVSDASTPRASNAIPGQRINFANGELKVGYLANDPPSGEKCRTMINSWPVPTRRTLTWDLSFKLGGYTASEAWPVTKATQTPTLLWQLKADPGFPSMGFFVDTSSEDASKIQLTFFQRSTNQSFNDFRWVIPDLPRDKPIDVVIQANLDDRDAPANQGTLRVWVNGKLVADRIGRNLVQGISDPHRWAFGVYLTSESYAVPQSRVTIWRRARMLVNP